MSTAKYPQKNSLHKFNLTNRVNSLSYLDEFFAKATEIGLLSEKSQGKTTLSLYKYNNINEALIVELSKRNEHRKSHVFVRPAFEVESRYLLLDDLDVDKVRKVLSDLTGNKSYDGMVIVETSNSNYQVWLRFNQNYTNEEKAAMIKYFGADKACSPRHRWGRCPNFLNVKDKHFDVSKDNYFYSHIKNVASFVDVVESGSTYTLSDNLKEFIKSDLEAQNAKQISYVASPKPKIDADGVVISCSSNNNVTARKQLSRDMYYKGDESQADCSYMRALLNQNVTKGEIFERILAERKNWKNHSNPIAYLERTYKYATRIV